MGRIFSVFAQHLGVQFAIMPRALDELDHQDFRLVPQRETPVPSAAVVFFLAGMDVITLFVLLARGAPIEKSGDPEIGGTGKQIA